VKGQPKADSDLREGGDSLLRPAHSQLLDFKLSGNGDCPGEEGKKSHRQSAKMQNGPKEITRYFY
jgi:hypothetical protein